MVATCPLVARLVAQAAQRLTRGRTPPISASGERCGHQLRSAEGVLGSGRRRPGGGRTAVDWRPFSPRVAGSIRPPGPSSVPSVQPPGAYSVYIYCGSRAPQAWAQAHGRRHGGHGSTVAGA
jgi:hypothetical protein